MKTRLLIILTICVTCIGCTSIKSTSLGSAHNAGGLTYFMPSRDLLVNFNVVNKVDAETQQYLLQKNPLLTKRAELVAMRLTVAGAPYLVVLDQQINKIDKEIAALGTQPERTTSLAASVSKVAVSDIYPDTRNAFSLHPGLNHFGKNTLDVSVSSKGLLSKTQSKTESQVSEAVINLASSKANLKTGKTAAVSSKEDQNVCPRAGSYQRRIRFDDMALKVLDGDAKLASYSEEVICANQTYRLSVKKYWGGNLRNGPACVEDNTCKAKAGLFYRQPLPYSVEVNLKTTSENGVVTYLPQLSATIYSPSESPISMLPIKKSFFADNDANFTFEDGVPTKYEEVSDGEIVSLLKLPADVLSAYFSAVGSVFEGFKTADTSEAESLTKQLELQLLKKKVDDCLDALETNDVAKIGTLNCSE
jgi:hypothetical protein